MTLNSSSALSAKSCTAVASLFIVLAVAVNCGGLILPYLARGGVILACIGALFGLVVLSARYEKLAMRAFAVGVSVAVIAISYLWYRAATVGIGPQHITFSPIGSVFAVAAVALGAACCAVHAKDGTHTKLQSLDRYTFFAFVCAGGELLMLAVIYGCLGGK